MKLVEDTESPRIFHVWAALGAVSAALGRRCWFSMGHTLTYPNQYIVLVGTPASRKSTAMKIAKRLITSSTNVRLAQDDTAGNRQGLIAEMMDGVKVNPVFLNGQLLAAKDNTLASITLREMAQITDEIPEGQEEAVEIAKADQQTLLATSDEFSRFIGENASQMLEFLTSCWDGEPYKYRTKSESIVLSRPLLSIIGCTTPAQLARALPAAAADEGILSRIILVYGARKHRLIPDPASLPVELKDKISELLHAINTELHGEFLISPPARAELSGLYTYNLRIVDNRFAYYAQRRYAHLQKIAMALAASRLSMVIEKCDVIEAHRILEATELGMPSALGQFGLHPLAGLKQKVLEFMRDVAVMEIEELRGNFHRDCRASEFMEVVLDLTKSGQLAMQQNAQGRAYVSALGGKYQTDETIVQALNQA
jgi:hypothetical protein